MDFEKNVPGWDNAGTEPPEDLKASGFSAGYKPPAAFFNWFWHGVSACLTEIRSKLSGHAENKENPHDVTKSQIGLGNVDNTADSAKSVKYATSAGAASKVNSNMVVKLNGGTTEGTDMFTFNGSAAKSVNITPGGIGAAASSHNHSAGDITSGTLAVARGGTGVTANPSMLTNLGSTSAASVFAASPRPGVTGTLPVANGGTGATTAAAARANLGAAASSHGHAASDVSGLATVATSGSYDDLTDKPEIPDGVTVDSALSSSSTNPVQNKVVNSALSGKAPTNHASSATTYGAGTGSNYGHVKLSDATDSTSGASAGIAATPAAVKAAYDLANGKANSSHNHSASDINSGTLPVSRGGTGNSSVDTTPTSDSTKMVTSGGVYTALAGKADASHTHTEYAASSHNHSASDITSGTLPVARGGTGNTSVDTTPTSGSTKMVTSGGIYTALAGKADASHTHTEYAASSHNHSASDINSGTLPVSRGGTGNSSVDTTPTSDSTKMVTSGGVYTALAGKADASHTHTEYAASSHTHAASDIKAGTLAGKVVANASAVATLTNAQVRNIQASTTDLTAGSSALATGQVYLVYE